MTAFWFKETKCLA